MVQQNLVLQDCAGYRHVLHFKSGSLDLQMFLANTTQAACNNRRYMSLLVLLAG